MGKKRIIAETGAGQHGVASATVAARFGMSCVVYMGAEDMKRQSANVYRMRLLGAEVRRWLPSAFCAAAALPHIRPERRKNLLQSISEAAATAPAWSVREPSFFPEWVEQEAA